MSNKTVSAEDLNMSNKTVSAQDLNMSNKSCKSWNYSIYLPYQSSYNNCLEEGCTIIKNNGQNTQKTGLDHLNTELVHYSDPHFFTDTRIGEGGVGVHNLLFYLPKVPQKQPQHFPGREATGS